MQINAVRDKLINYEVFLQGQRKLGMADVTLPEINYKTDTLSGAGIGGDIDMPTLGQTDSMELGIKWRTINEDVTALLKQEAQDLEIRGANQHYDAGTGKLAVQAVKVNVRGLAKKGNFGTATPASKTEAESTLEILYLKITIDGKKKVEIDKLNYIHYVDGVDYLEAVRNALGL